MTILTPPFSTAPSAGVSFTMGGIDAAMALALLRQVKERQSWS